MKLYGFELPAPFSNFLAALTAPPRVGIVEARPVAEVIAHPSIMFYDPDTVKLPAPVHPVVPGNPNVTAGLDMIAYDHQPQWDRNAPIAGPVRAFFAGVMYDNRVKHS